MQACKAVFHSFHSSFQASLAAVEFFCFIVVHVVQNGLANDVGGRFVFLLADVIKAFKIFVSEAGANLGGLFCFWHGRALHNATTWSIQEIRAFQIENSALVGPSKIGIYGAPRKVERALYPALRETFGPLLRAGGGWRWLWCCLVGEARVSCG